MKRPTKPVMWTDEEATKRFIQWAQAYESRWYEATVSVLDSEKLPLMHTNIDYFDHFIGLITQDGCKQTIDSLLHDLNIIKPIGRLEYTSDWIDKILAGTKTMSIRKTQYMCGFYELWDTERQEVRGIVEVEAIHKLMMVDGELHMSYCDYGSFPIYTFWRDACGFESDSDFSHYHRTHFQSVKYAITYRLVDMKGDSE